MNSQFISVPDARSRPRRRHWSTSPPDGDRAKTKSSGSGFTEFCQQYETVELWFDTDPSAQLQLIWLLDYFRSHPKTVAKLKLRLVDLEMIGLERLGKWMPPAIDVTEKELATASAAWQAYRAATPEDCFDLLGQDLSALPLLRPVLTDLLEELPSASTGLGATEMRMLELIARGYSLTNALFHLRSLRQTRIFNEWEHGYLLDGLAFGPVPAVAGLEEELRTLSRQKLRDRQVGLPPKPVVVDRIRQGDCRAQGRFQPAQPDRPLVGWHPPDQRSPVALESDADEAE